MGLGEEIITVGRGGKEKKRGKMDLCCNMMFILVMYLL